MSNEPTISNIAVSTAGANVTDMAMVTSDPEARPTRRPGKFARQQMPRPDRVDDGARRSGPRAAQMNWSSAVRAVTPTHLVGIHDQVQKFEEEARRDLRSVLDPTGQDSSEWTRTVSPEEFDQEVARVRDERLKRRFGVYPTILNRLSLRIEAENAVDRITNWDAIQAFLDKERLRCERPFPVLRIRAENHKHVYVACDTKGCAVCGQIILAEKAAKAAEGFLRTPVELPHLYGPNSHSTIYGYLIRHKSAKAAVDYATRQGHPTLRFRADEASDLVITTHRKRCKPSTRRVIAEPDDGFDRLFGFVLAELVEAPVMIGDSPNRIDFNDILLRLATGHGRGEDGVLDSPSGDGRESYEAEHDEDAEDQEADTVYVSMGGRRRRYEQAVQVLGLQHSVRNDDRHSGRLHEVTTSAPGTPEWRGEMILLGLDDQIEKVLGSVEVLRATAKDSEVSPTKPEIVPDF